MASICVTTISQDNKRIWGNRKEAWDYFVEKLQISTGDEQIGYANILSQLAVMKDLCKDK